MKMKKPCRILEATGVDLYNQCLTGGVSKTLNAIKCDADHTPVAIIRFEHEEDEDICGEEVLPLGRG